MEKIEYLEERIFKLLYEEIYKGYKIVILNLGTHPCAYIGTADKENPFYEKTYNELGDMDYYGDVHGGFTFSGFGLSGFYKDFWFLGWDYGHAGDYLGYDGGDSKDKKWTTEEIFKEARKQVDILIKLKWKEVTSKKLRLKK